MKALNSKKTLIIATVLTISFFLGVSSLLQNKQKPEKIYQKQTQIFNHIKMKIQPISITNGDTFSFHITYETFQNPDFLESDLKDITILEDHLGNPYSASTWEFTQENDYKKTGILTFRSSTTIPEQLTLYVYHPNETKYTWLFNNKSNIAQKKDDHTK